MGGCEISLWLVAGGYLPRYEDGKPRVLDQLDRLGREMLRLGVRLRYGTPPEKKAACSCWWRNEIIIAPRLWWCEADDIRYALTHELCHIHVGRSCEEARWRQQRVYGDLFAPAWAA